MANDVTILYDGDGRAMSVRRQQMSAFDGAATGRRTKSWSPTREDANSLVFGNIDLLRARAHDVIRKVPYAENALSSYVANSVGVGIKPQSQHIDPAKREYIHQRWLRWTDESDADGVHDLYGQQKLTCRSERESGECFVRFRYRRPEDGLSVPLQLQILEADHLPTYGNLSTEPVGNNKVHFGIEKNAFGKRVAYHFYREHPGSTTFTTNGETVRVPADQVLHLFERQRPGQDRGIPWLTPALLTIWQLGSYVDAQVEKQKVAAMFVGVLKTTTPNDPNSIMPVSTRNGQTGDVDLVPGTYQVLKDGEEMTFSDPPDAGSFADFVRVSLRAIAAGLGITYEMISNDMTGVNYSSARVALLEFRRRCEAFQHQVLAYQFCRPVFNAWLRAGYLSGTLDLPGYDQDPWQYENVRWITPGFPWVDPLKDVKAKIMEVRAGFASRAGVVSEKGDDIEQIDAENKADFGDNLTYDSNPMKAENAQAQAQADAMIQQTEEEEKRMVIQ